MNSSIQKVPQRKRLFKREERVILGKQKGSLFRKVGITESELNHHVHIVGASGFGKTVLLSHLIRQRIQQGKGLLFLDLKGDLDTIEKFKSYAREVGREDDVKVLSLSHKEISTSYNLLGGGTATQLRDRIMLSFTWSEEFYKNQAANFLLKLLTGLCWLRDNKGVPLDLASLTEALSSKQHLEDLALQIPESETKVRKCVEEVHQLSKDNGYWLSLQGLRNQVESLILSDFGDLISSHESGIDLFDAARGSKIVLIFLDSRRYGETAKTIGRFILQDLKFASAKVDSEVPKHERLPFSVIVDEFADLAQEDFIAFLDRARSSRFSVVVAHQELCDLERISPEFAGRLMGNTATVFAFLQKRAESAEILSGLAGTRTTRKKTYQYEKFLFWDVPTGASSVREVEEFIIHPNVIKSLRVGECVAIKKYPSARAHRVVIYRESVPRAAKP